MKKPRAYEGHESARSPGERKRIDFVDHEYEEIGCIRLEQTEIEEQSSSEMFMAEQALMEQDASCEQPALYIRPGRAIHLGGWALSHEKSRADGCSTTYRRTSGAEAAMLIYGWIVAGVVVGCVGAVAR